MTDKLQYTGIWTIPKVCEDKFHGTLTVENGDIELELIGVAEMFWNKQFIVHGLSVEGKKITLFKCSIFQTTNHVPGLQRTLISALYFFEGGLVEEDELKFEAAYITFRSLDVWLGIGGFKNFERDFDKHDISLEYSLPKDILLFQNDDVEFSFYFDFAAPIILPHRRCEIVQECQIRIKSLKPFSIDEFWQYVKVVKSFFTLAFFSEVLLTKVVVEINSQNFQMIYVGQNKSQTKEKTHHRQFLFLYKTVMNDLTTIFNRWFDLCKFIDPIVSIMVDLFDAQKTNIENRFLNVMHGIETFHRRLRKNTLKPIEEYKSYVNNLISFAPAEEQKWLKEKLLFSNELTLKERLSELFSEMDKPIIEHLFPDYEKLIIDAKNSRNYLTHFNQDLEKKALKNSELHVLTEKLKLFLLIVLLKETGFNNTEVTEIIVDSSKYLFNHLIASKIDDKL